MGQSPPKVSAASSNKQPILNVFYYTGHKRKLRVELLSSLVSRRTIQALSLKSHSTIGLLHYNQRKMMLRTQKQGTGSPLKIYLLPLHPHLTSLLHQHENLQWAQCPTKVMAVVGSWGPQLNKDKTAHTRPQHHPLPDSDTSRATVLNRLCQTPRLEWPVRLLADHATLSLFRAEVSLARLQEALPGVRALQQEPAH